MNRPEMKLTDANGQPLSFGLVGVQPAAHQACASCPWRMTNLGKAGPRVMDDTHLGLKPYGWFSRRNLDRLWAGLRRGERMTCHPTDERSEGTPAGAETRECTGSLVIVQREAVMLNDDFRGNLREYRRARPKGMSKGGMLMLVERYVFGGIPIIGGSAMTLPDLNDPDINYEPLGMWKARTSR